MRKDLVDITLVIDKSGSMQKLVGDTIGGVNKLIADQRKVEGDANVSIVLFDTTTSFLCNGTPLKGVPELNEYNYKPSGNTSLLDAVGTAINATGGRLRAMPEHERPAKVVFVIVTDGEENSSRTFTKPQIKAMIEEQSGKYSWDFVYLGANVDAFHEASQIGIAGTLTANYGANKIGTYALYNTVSDKLGTLRSRAYKGETTTMAFTVNEQKKLEDTIKTKDNT